MSVMCVCLAICPAHPSADGPGPFVSDTVPNEFQLRKIVTMRECFGQNLQHNQLQITMSSGQLQGFGIRIKISAQNNGKEHPPERCSKYVKQEGSSGTAKDCN